MAKDQIKLLQALAKQRQTEKRSKAEILSSFVKAGILDKNGNFTEHYPNLRKAVK